MTCKTSENMQLHMSKSASGVPATAVRIRRESCWNPAVVAYLRPYMATLYVYVTELETVLSFGEGLAKGETSPGREDVFGESSERQRRWDRRRWAAVSQTMVSFLLVFLRAPLFPIVRGDAILSK